MSYFQSNTGFNSTILDLLAPAGHQLLSGDASSYSYAGATPTQIVYVFGTGFTYQNGVVVSGSANTVIGIDQGTPQFQAQFYGSDHSIATLATQTFAQQIATLRSGDDTFSDNSGQSLIDGGTGNDTARLLFNFADASFGLQNGVLSITAPGHQDQIINVEQFQFNDRTFGSLAALEQSAGIGTTAHPVFRFYDTVTNDHFYTTDPVEKASIQANLKTFTYEGTPWSTPDAGVNTHDVYRFYDTVTKTHFLTDSVAERDTITKTLPSLTFEGVAFQAYNSVENTSEYALERFYNTNTKIHTYAADASEATLIKSGAVGQGWVDEGASFIVHV